MHFFADTIWLSNGVCVIRVAGDLCLVAAAPWLLYTMHKSGAAGISVETQMLRLLVFFTRYLDLLTGNTVSMYNMISKCIILVTSLHVVTSLIFRHKAYKLADFKDKIFHLCLPLVFAIIMAANFTYQRNISEFAWAFSQYLGSVSDVSQMVLFYNSRNRDKRMAIYLALAAGYRAFYIPHWLLRYLYQNIVDPISVFSGTVSTAIYLIALVMILYRRYRLSGSGSQVLEDGATKTSDEALSSEGDLITFPPDKN